MTPPLRRGDFVDVTAEGRTVKAMVTLASPCGRSVILMFDAMLGSWVAQMPAYENDDGTWAALDGMPIQVARLTT